MGIEGTDGGTTIPKDSTSLWYICKKAYTIQHYLHSIVTFGSMWEWIFHPLIGHSCSSLRSSSTKGSSEISNVKEKWTIFSANGKEVFMY